MDGLPLHPALVHLPLGLAFAMPLVALGLLGAWLSGRLPRATWWLAAGLQVVVLAAAIVSLRTGEAEEELVEEVTGHEVIHEHEERAEAFTVAAGVTLALMVGAPLIPREGLGKALAGAAALGTIVTAGLGASVGHLGGELVYEHGAAAAYTGATPGAPHRAADDDAAVDGDHDD